MTETCNAGEGSDAHEFELDEQRRLARENWLQERGGGGARLDLEDVRRIAREEWLSKFAK
jgi:hypothetical protein